jgi:hypothetical protein
MIADRRGARVIVRPDTPDETVALAIRALLARLMLQSDRDIVVETIDGQPASGSRLIDVFRDAGFRRGTVGLRYYRGTR